MANVPDLTGMPYSQASDELGNEGLGIIVLGTKPRGGSWTSSWVVDYQDTPEGDLYPVPIGYAVGVVLKAPTE